jgi:hypothetical protein
MLVMFRATEPTRQTPDSEGKAPVSAGVWHGLIAPITFIVSAFSRRPESTTCTTAEPIISVSCWGRLVPERRILGAEEKKYTKKESEFQNIYPMSLSCDHETIPPF